MPRYSDQWLIDKTMFDVVYGGGCACCSFNFMPNGTVGLIQSMSELETDAKEKEISDLAKLPWPQEVSMNESSGSAPTIVSLLNFTPFSLRMLFGWIECD